MTNYQIRLILKKEGLDLLSNTSLKDIIKSADINKSFGDLTYIGWNSLNAESCLLLKNKIFDVGYNDISYRMTCIGEDLTDIEEEQYTSYNDENNNIPFPSVIRTFDEKDMENQLNGYLEYLESKKEINSIEYN